MICPSSWHQPPNVLLLISMTVICFLSHHVVDGYDSAPATLSHSAGGRIYGGSGGSGGHNLESRSSYAMLSEAMSHAVSHEFSHTAGSGSADGACSADDLECNNNLQDRLGMEAIRSLHRQLDDDDNGNIDLEESDDFLREELKYEAGYEKRHKTFHYNDDSQISVKELWEAWLRSEVHNWTVEQTTDWLSQSVQLPQYVDIFKNHKVSGAALPRLAVNNMHFVSNVLGIKDPIHKQKIALKAMDVVLFGPPRETGTRWKDYILVTLLLSAIIGGWYAYQQNKNAKRHLRRMAQDMEGLQKAENALTEMQKELERARMEQENVATEKLDLERRLKEAPLLTSNSSDMELQQLKQEIEMLRTELSRAEVELVDHCWSPPPGLQTWLQLTYELESKNHLKKRVLAEKQLQSAREACEKLRRKRSSLVGAFVSTHGKSIDDVDRSIVEARNALSDVTYELQERLHRWKQVETLLGLSIVNNNGLSYLENVLYTRNGSGKFTRGIFDSSNHGRCRDDSSASDDGDNMSVTFSVGGSIPILPTSFINSNTVAPSGGGGNPIMTTTNTLGTVPPSQLQQLQQQQQQTQPPQLQSSVSLPYPSSSSIVTSVPSSAATPPILQLSNFNHHPLNSSESVVHSQLDDTRQSSSSSMVSQEKVVVPMPRAKKMPIPQPVSTRAPMPPPRRANSHQSFSTNNHIIRSHSADLVAMESTSSAVVSAAPHGDTQLDDNSTDSSSLDDETKKRRRKLRFPFGKKTIKDKNA